MFLRLHKVVLNTHNITQVRIYKDAYHISLKNTTGFMLAGSGSFDSERIIVTEGEEGYDKVTRWIDSLDNEVKTDSEN